MDDDPDCLIVTQYTLELLGYRCLSTPEAEEVTALAEKHQPDLFLLDIVTPTLGGIELFQQLRQIPQFTDVPIVALTALALERERHQILAAGFDDFLSKPFFLEDLVRLMHRNLPDPQALHRDLQVVEPRSTETD